MEKQSDTKQRKSKTTRPLVQFYLKGETEVKAFEDLMNSTPGISNREKMKAIFFSGSNVEAETRAQKYEEIIQISELSKAEAKTLTKICKFRVDELAPIMENMIEQNTAFSSLLQRMVLKQQETIEELQNNVRSLSQNLKTINQELARSIQTEFKNLNEEVNQLVTNRKMISALKNQHPKLYTEIQASVTAKKGESK